MSAHEPIDATTATLPPETLGWSIEAFCNCFDPPISPHRVRVEIAAGRLDAQRRLGNRAIVTKDAALRWLASLPVYHRKAIP